MISMFAVMIPVLIDRYRLERLRHEYDELRLEVENRSCRPALWCLQGWPMKNFQFLFAAWMAGLGRFSGI